MNKIKSFSRINQNRVRIIRFHLIMDRELLSLLMNSEFREIKNIYRKAEAIIDLFYKKNPDFLQIAVNERSKREKVIDNRDIHLYIPIEVYRWAKNQHAIVNVHGIAGILRAILRYYVELFKQYGEKEATRIFTGESRYRVLRAFVRLKSELKINTKKIITMRAQLTEHQFIFRDFVIYFVKLME